MRQVIDRLLEARTEIDDAIRRQLLLPGTVGNLRDTRRLEVARELVINAAHVLTDADSLNASTLLFFFKMLT